MAQGYHIFPAHPGRGEPRVEGEDAPRVEEDDGRSVALERGREEHLAGEDGAHLRPRQRRDVEAVVRHAGAVTRIQQGPEAGGDAAVRRPVEEAAEILHRLAGERLRAPAIEEVDQGGELALALRELARPRGERPRLALGGGEERRLAVAEGDERRPPRALLADPALALGARGAQAVAQSG